MRTKSLSIIIAITIILCEYVSADERIWLKDTKVNGKSVKLCFDSGSTVNGLFPDALKRLKLNLTTPTNDPSHGVLVGGDETICSLSINGVEMESQFISLDAPPDAGFDGFVGWWPLHEQIMNIDSAAKSVSFLSSVPRETTNWPCFTINNDFGILDFEVQQTNNVNGIIAIDTGSDSGIALPPREWWQWGRDHPHAPITLNTFYTPVDGVAICEEAWADEIKIGNFVITDVPVMREPQAMSNRLGDKGYGVLGLAALARLNVLIDGEHSIIYLKPKTTKPAAYPHNRLGAVFTPTRGHTNEAVAFVAYGSPAYDAGVRNGDVLLQVNDKPETVRSGHWDNLGEQSPGTKLHLLLSRHGTNFETTAILRQIIPPAK